MQITMTDESMNTEQIEIPPNVELNLLDVMEICSNMCLSQLLAAQILQEDEDLSEICGAELAGEIALLKITPFGKRLAQIH